MTHKVIAIEVPFNFLMFLNSLIMQPHKHFIGQPPSLLLLFSLLHDHLLFFVLLTLFMNKTHILLHELIANFLLLLDSWHSFHVLLFFFEVDYILISTLDMGVLMLCLFAS
jgi:hypothetical protein